MNNPERYYFLELSAEAQTLACQALSKRREVATYVDRIVTKEAQDAIILACLALRWEGDVTSTDTFRSLASNPFHPSMAKILWPWLEIREDDTETVGERLYQKGYGMYVLNKVGSPHTRPTQVMRAAVSALVGYRNFLALLTDAIQAMLEAVHDQSTERRKELLSAFEMQLLAPTLGEIFAEDGSLAGCPSIDPAAYLYLYQKL